MSAPRFVKSVVDTCLQIKREDRVLIFAWRHMLDLAEAFTMECKRKGAKTHLELGTDELMYHTASDLPLEYLRETDPFDLALLDVASANIFIQGPEDPEKLKDITPERWGALSESDKPYYEKLLEKKIRSAQITLGYVTRQRARTYGFNYDEWERNIHAAMDVKYEDMQDLGKKIGSMLEKASKARITAAGGTDLTLELEGREVQLFDGIIDDEDIRKGAILTALPSGYVAVAPKEKSAVGTYISNVPEAIMGVLVQNVEWTFKNGRLASFRGGKNIEVIKTMCEKAKGDNDQAGSLIIGLNPMAKKGFTYNHIVLGSVTLGVGDNREIGGKIQSNFEFHSTLAEATLKLDDRVVIKRGKLVL